jgi:hypothetical protein
MVGSAGRRRTTGAGKCIAAVVLGTLAAIGYLAIYVSDGMTGGAGLLFDCTRRPTSRPGSVRRDNPAASLRTTCWWRRATVKVERATFSCREIGGSDRMAGSRGTTTIQQGDATEDALRGSRFRWKTIEAR